MDVSVIAKNQSSDGGIESVTEIKENSGPNGLDLLETLVTLTGLPAPLIQNELGQILETNGQSSADLTLTDLRQALLTYLDAVQADVLAQSADSETVPPALPPLI